jgi:nitrate/nitrite-specific signal transduction histidine kinase
LIIEDDGVGFDCDAVLAGTRGGAHTGLQTMRERAHSIGGDLVIESDRGSGTLVRLRVPASVEQVPSGRHSPARSRPVPRRRASRLHAE